MADSLPHLLIVEDDPRFRETLRLEFAERGYLVSTASSFEEVRKLESLPLRFATVDLRLGADNGIAVVEYLKNTYAECRIVVLTGYGSIATAVEAVKRGANQYVTKPVNIDTLERTLWTDTPLAEDPDASAETISLARHEREYIEWILLQSDGNITEAAKRLGIHRQSLQRKLRKFTPR